MGLLFLGSKGSYDIRLLKDTGCFSVIGTIKPTKYFVSSCPDSEFTLFINRDAIKPNCRYRMRLKKVNIFDVCECGIHSCSAKEIHQSSVTLK